MNTISNVIRSQFPQVYTEDNTTLVAFVEAYYEFLEQNNKDAYYNISRMNDYRDVDTTLPEFIAFFNSKYLNDFPQAASIDQQTLIKHILDYYRSKGTERSIILLMRLLYGEEIDIYYPRVDILRPSDSAWISPQYIEIQHNSDNFKLIGNTVYSGNNSALVESIITKTINGKMIDIVYISDVRGNFSVDDIISIDGTLDEDYRILGSFVSFTITNGGSGYTIGDKLISTSNNGLGASGTVSQIAPVSDGLDIKLIDGGYGYTLDANTIITVSDNVILLSNPLLSFSPNFTVRHKLQCVSIVNTTSPYVIGEVVTGDVSTNQGVVVESNTSSVLVNIYNNTLIGSTNLYRLSDVSHVSPKSISGVTATHKDGKVVGQLVDRIGVKWNSNTNIVYYNPSYITKISLLDSANSGTVLTKDIGFVAGGTSTGFQINALRNTETINLNSDLLSTYANTALNAANYGFRANTTNANTILDNAFNFVSATIGEIDSLKLINPGINYNSDVFFRIENVKTLAYAKRDIVLNLSGTSSVSYKIGEIVTQNSKKGIVKSYTTNKLILKDISFNNSYAANSTPIIGLDSGATNLISSIQFVYNTLMAGENGIVTGKVTQFGGTVSLITISDSGFGYIDDETMSFYIPGSLPITGKAVLNGIGKQKGYWNTTTSQLNSEKKIHDNYYYQDYSYVIKAKSSLDAYENILKSLSHVAGSKYFGEVNIKSDSNLIVTGSSSIVIV